MALYTERHGMRKRIERTSNITVEMYAILFDCCEKYYDNLAWKFSDQCPDGYGICGLNFKKFNTHMLFDIPSLPRDFNGQICKPKRIESHEQYALLDLIEFIGKNIRDITNRRWHPYYRHEDLSFADTGETFGEFREEINSIFEKTGLLFTLTTDKTIERVLEDSVLTAEIETDVGNVKEPGIKELFEEAITLFKRPDPANRNGAVEKLWDAFERLKTYYTMLDKKASAKKIVKDMSSGQSAFEELFESEFRELTNIGNNYRIRHHETNKTNIQDVRHCDYFFNRCLALIATALKYLQ
jgi:hypothetical protein